MKTLAYILLFTLSAQAFCDDVLYVQKGVPAPITGYLFSSDREKALRLTDENLSICTTKTDLLQKKADLTTDMLNLSSQRADLYQKNSEALSKELQSHTSDSFWKNSLYFLGGALVTGLIAAGVSHAVR